MCLCNQRIEHKFEIRPTFNYLFHLHRARFALAILGASISSDPKDTFCCVPSNAFKSSRFVFSGMILLISFNAWSKILAIEKFGSRNRCMQSSIMEPGCNSRKLGRSALLPWLLLHFQAVSGHVQIPPSSRWPGQAVLVLGVLVSSRGLSLAVPPGTGSRLPADGHQQIYTRPGPNFKLNYHS